MEYNYFYKITNIVNNKFYYGVHKTDNLNDSYLGSGVAIRYAQKKYGRKNFTKEILKFFDTFEECLVYEALIVDEDMVKDRMCYNLRTGGLGGVPSKETRAKISACRKGRKHSDEAKAKIGACRKEKGIICTAETRKKISDSLKGKPLSESVKENMRKPKSEEAKRKMRKPKSEETKRKMSEFWRKRREEKNNVK